MNLNDSTTGISLYQNSRARKIRGNIPDGPELYQNNKSPEHTVNTLIRLFRGTMVSTEGSQLFIYEI